MRVENTEFWDVVGVHKDIRGAVDHLDETQAPLLGCLVEWGRQLRDTEEEEQKESTPWPCVREERRRESYFKITTTL